MSTVVDLSFARYVAARKGLAAARRREGAVYGFGGDLRLRGWMERVRPVTMALEAAQKYVAQSRERILNGAVRVDEQHFPAVAIAAAEAAGVLGLEVPLTFVVPEPAEVDVRVLGSDEQPLVLVPARAVDGLPPLELKAALGEALGHVQNGHVPYLTALWALAQSDDLVARWAGRPARAALDRWALRGALTADRAALIVTRDLRATLASLVRRALGRRRLLAEVDVDGFFGRLDERGRMTGDADPEAARLRIGARVRSLELFARTTFFRGVVQGPGGEVPSEPPLPKDECDARAGALLGDAP